MTELLEAIRHAEWPAFVLALCGAIVLAIAIERTRYYHQIGATNPGLLAAVRADLRADRIDHALEQSRASWGVLARALTAALVHADRPLLHISAAVDEVVDEELARLRRWMPALVGLASIAFLSGLAGTLFGLMDVFRSTSCEPVIRNIPAEIATTLRPAGVGLIACVLALAVRAGLQAWSEAIEGQLRHAAVAIVNLFRQDTTRT